MAGDLVLDKPTVDIDKWLVPEVNLPDFTIVFQPVEMGNRTCPTGLGDRPTCTDSNIPGSYLRLN